MISDDQRYRYSLTREWGEGDWAVWIMLNPSTADASSDDATIRRCIGFSQRWGYGGLVVINLFALRSPDPKMLYRNPLATGGKQNRRVAISEATDRDVIAAWGAGAKGWSVYVDFFATRLQEAARSLTCLGETKDGHPRHPVHLPYATERVPWPVLSRTP